MILNQNAYRKIHQYLVNVFSQNNTYSTNPQKSIDSSFSNNTAQFGSALKKSAQ